MEKGTRCPRTESQTRGSTAKEIRLSSESINFSTRRELGDGGQESHKKMGRKMDTRENLTVPSAG